MEIKKLGSKIKTGETRLGVYVWEMPDGRWIGDDDQNFLSIQSMKDDISRINLLAQAVRGYGITEGKPKFLEGSRQIDDEEFQIQKTRLALGLVPDELDIGVYKDDMKKLGKK